MSLEDSFDIGDVLSLEMVLFEGRTPVNAIGRVVRKEDGSVALEFLEVDGDGDAQLKEYIEARRKKEPEEGAR